MRTVFERNAPSAAAVDAALSESVHRTYWLADVASHRVSYPTLTADIDCDLLIVGGGYCGLWTAIQAKRRDPDARVVVLEASRVGWAASGRNGGFCDASLTHGVDNGFSRWPEEMPTLEEMGRENLDGVERDIAEFGIDAEFERTGSIDVAVEPHQVDWLREIAAEAEAVADEDVTLLDRDAMRATVASPSYLAGLVHAESTALVHPAKLSLELARAAANLGVEIFEHVIARDFETVGRGAAARERVVTSAGHRVTAARIALATNVFPSLLKRNRLMTVPVYDYVLATEPLNVDVLTQIGWQGRQGIADIGNQFHYYRLTRDNRVIFGGYDAVYHAGGRVRAKYEDRLETFRRLASHFLTTFPQAEGVRFTHRWAGAIDTCSRYCAFFGTARGGRVGYAAGFTGLGVAATRFAADVMLDLLAGESTARTELEMVRQRPVPFPPEPFTSAAVAAMRWSLDRADHNEGRRNLILKTADVFGLGFDS